MVSENNEPADLAGFRARRAALKEEHRRQKARDNFTAEAPDYGREIPPRLNPDILDMVDRVKACYLGLTQWIVGFQDEIVALVDAGKLDPGERTGLLEQYRHLQEAVDAATADALKWHPVAGVHDFTDSRGRIPDFVHRLADHAKYVYAVGSRDIAAMQYRLAELAHTGRLDPEVHRGLQWNHCLPMWETLYHGTTSAVRDERTWDGGWDWADNTYSDGRQVMAQVRVKNWQILDRDWPYNGEMCGDGPIQEHPRGSLCQIAPVHDPEKDHYKYHPAIEIDLEELIEQLGPPPLDVNTLDDLAIESAQESLLLEPPGLGRKKGEVPGLRTPRGAPVAGIPVNSSISGRA
ncbi:MAG: hypothetical protein ACLP75_22830 [Mycobacterium sp.]|uniref:hypothetical protein n=1 Tax=Mycobacterium sp. TaxID=1785 RepID=UPI003F9A001F